MYRNERRLGIASFRPNYVTTYLAIGLFSYAVNEVINLTLLLIIAKQPIVVNCFCKK